MPFMGDEFKSGEREIALQVPVDLYSLYLDLATDSNVTVHEALLQGLRFAMRSRKSRSRRRITVPLPTPPPSERP